MSHLCCFVSFPAQPPLAQSIQSYFETEWASEHARVTFPELLQSIGPLLPMSPEHLAKESLPCIREKLSNLIRKRKWQAESLMTTQPHVAECILIENTKLAYVRQQLEDFM